MIAYSFVQEHVPALTNRQVLEKAVPGRKREPSGTVISTMGRPDAARSHGMGTCVIVAATRGVSNAGALGFGVAEGLGMGLLVNTGLGDMEDAVGLISAGPVAVRFAETVWYTHVEPGNGVPAAPCGSVQEANMSNKYNPEDKTLFFFIFY
jgi:hypothetical protein